MDPNNDQLNNQQLSNQQQANSVPQNPVETVAQQGVQYQNQNTNKGNKTVFVLVVLLVLVLGLTFYLIFVNMKNSTPQKLPASNVQITPSSTPVPPTPTAGDDLSVEDPEVDIKVLDDAASTL